MTRIRGMTVTLISKVETGEDEFGRPTYRDLAIPVDNVLVAPVTSEDAVNALDLHGKRAVYVLGIPKSDTHDWEDVEVRFFDETWRTFGKPMEGIEEMIPLEWNKKVMVERYE